MARKGKPLGNKRQHEQAKARKKREKEARKAARKSGHASFDEFGNPVMGEEGPEDDFEESEGETPVDSSEEAGAESDSEREDDPG